jgi:TetR/AcrR family transcriptional regulator, transcriptional repressor for nem operon
MAIAETQDPNPKTRTSARDRILDLAEAAVLRKGFGATSIDELVTGAGITKSGFFYHFKDKGDLAKALLERYLERDHAILEDIFGRARELHDDPLHRFLIALKLFAEMLENLPESHPGCLAAAFCYQDQLFSREIRDLNAEGVLAWRRRLLGYLEEIAALYPPRFEIDLNTAADMLATLVEGGIILSRVLKEQEVLARQVLLYRAFIQSAFMPGPA